MKAEVTDTKMLTAPQRQAIDAWVAKFPVDQKQSAIIPALMLLQEENGGHLTQPDMDNVADYLGMARIAVYEVVSFYSMFRLKPVGENVISVCTNVSCMLCGSEALLAHLEKRLNICEGETTSDGRFTLHAERECLAGCVDAPLVAINKTYYEKLTPEKIDNLLAEFEKS